MHSVYCTTPEGTIPINFCKNEIFSFSLHPTIFLLIYPLHTLYICFYLSCFSLFSFRSLPLPGPFQRRLNRNGQHSRVNKNNLIPTGSSPFLFLSSGLWAHTGISASKCHLNISWHNKADTVLHLEWRQDKTPASLFVCLFFKTEDLGRLRVLQEMKIFFLPHTTYSSD